MTSEKDFDKMTLSDFCKINAKSIGNKQLNCSRFADEVCVGSIEDDVVTYKKVNETKPIKTKSLFKKWWKKDETCAFYKGLLVCGLDFSLLEAYMNYTRTRSQLLNKYKTECKVRPQTITLVTNYHGKIDKTTFSKIMESISNNS